MWFQRNVVQGFCSNREVSIPKDLKNLKIIAARTRKIGHYVKLRIFLYIMRHFCEKWKFWKKTRTSFESFRLWFSAQNLAQKWIRLKFSCSFQKIKKSQKCFFCTWWPKNEIKKKSKTHLNRFDYDTKLKILLKRKLDLTFM